MAQGMMIGAATKVSLPVITPVPLTVIVAPITLARAWFGAWLNWNAN